MFCSAHRCSFPNPCQGLQTDLSSPIITKGSPQEYISEYVHIHVFMSLFSCFLGGVQSSTVPICPWPPGPRCPGQRHNAGPRFLKEKDAQTGLALHQPCLAFLTLPASHNTGVPRAICFLRSLPTLSPNFSLSLSGDTQGIAASFKGRVAGTLY